MNIYDETINKLCLDIIRERKIIKDSKWWQFSKKNKARLNINSYKKCVDHLIIKSTKY